MAQSARAIERPINKNREITEIARRVAGLGHAAISARPEVNGLPVAKGRLLFPTRICHLLPSWAASRPQSANRLIRHHLNCVPKLAIPHSGKNCTMKNRKSCFPWDHPETVPRTSPVVFQLWQVGQDGPDPG